MGSVVVLHPDKRMGDEVPIKMSPLDASLDKKDASTSPLFTSPATYAVGADSEPVLESIQTRVLSPKPTLAISDIEVRARVQWGQVASHHFLVYYDKLMFGEQELQTTVAALEEGYSSIFSLTHEAFADRFTVFLLDQRASELLGRTLRSHINIEQRAIYLVRTPTRPIYAELILWLSHAMRITRYQRHYGKTPGWAMLEDAFAVFLNVRLTTYSEAFPFFGTESDVIAYHIHKTTQVGTLKDIWLSPQFAGMLERYVLAGALFLYLGDTYSDDRVVAFSKCDGEITNDTFRIFFRKPLSELETEWTSHLPTTQLSLTEEDRRFVISQWEKLMALK